MGGGCIDGRLEPLIGPLVVLQQPTVAHWGACVVGCAVAARPAVGGRPPPSLPSHHAHDTQVETCIGLSCFSCVPSPVSGWHHLACLSVHKWLR